MDARQGYESTVITIIQKQPGAEGSGGDGSKGSAVIVEDGVTIEVSAF